MQNKYQTPAMTMLFALLCMFGPVTVDLYLPNIPAIATTLNATVPAVQSTITVFALGFGFGQLIHGSFSDRFGRFPILIIGLVIYVVTSILCVFVTHIFTLYVLRFFQAVSACSGVVIARAIINDTHELAEASKKIALTVIVLLIAPIVAPLIGGYIGHYFGWRMNFILMAVFGVLLLIACLVMIRETNVHKDLLAIKPKYVLRNYFTLLTNRIYFSHLSAAVCAFGGFFTFVTVAPTIIMVHFRIAKVNFGWSYGAIMIGFMLGALISKYLVNRWSLPKIVWMGTVIGTTASLLLVLAAIFFGHSLIIFTLLVTVFTFSVGIIFPNSVAQAIRTFPQKAGVATALIGFTQFTLAFLVGEILNSFSAHAFFALALALLIFMVVCLVSVMTRVKGAQL